MPASCREPYGISSRPFVALTKSQRVSALERFLERPVVADRVSMALCQETDAHPTHEIFKGHNVARTPLSTAGQLLPFVPETELSFERPLLS